MIKMTIQDTEETAEFKVLEKPIIQKPLIAESDVVTIDNNLSTYVTGTQKREVTVGLGYLDSIGYETLRRIRDRQYAVLKYPTVTITADEPVDLGYGEDVPDYRQRLVQLNGKNLFDKNSVEYLVGYPTATTIVSNTYHRTIYIPCEPNTTYTVQKINQGNNKRFALATTSVLPDINVAVLQLNQDNNADSITITTDNAANYLLVWCWVTNDAGVTWDDILNSLQIEKGPTATTYEPYYNIELCKIGTYQDYIYKSGSKWYVHKEVLKYQLTGSETYTTRTNTSTTHGKYRISNAILASNIAAEKALSCSHFVANVGANEAAYSENAICGSSQSGYQKMLWFSIANSIVGSLDAFKTWVANNRPIVYYAIATPTETEITNDTLKAQLNALQNSAFDRWTKVETEVQELSLQPYLTVTQGEITGSGKEVMLEGTTEDLLDFVIFGDTFQKTYSGKNLLPNNLQTQTLNEVTFTRNNDGSIKISGTATARAEPMLWQTSQGGSLVFTAGKTYKNTTDVTLYFRAANYFKIDPGATYSPTANQNCNQAYIRVENGEAIDTTIFPQIVESGVDESYEPYVGGVPSPNPDYPQEVRTVNGDINFDFSGPSGVKKYTMVGKMTLAEQRIIDNCGTNEQVQVSFRESKQL